MECLYWPGIQEDRDRSDITHSDLHGVALPGQMHCTDTHPITPTLHFVQPDKLFGS